MSEKVFSVRVVKALMEDCLADGNETLSESELLSILEVRPTPRAADGFTAEEISQIRRIARDVVSGGGE